MRCSVLWKGIVLACALFAAASGHATTKKRGTTPASHINYRSNFFYYNRGAHFAESRRKMPPTAASAPGSGSSSGHVRRELIDPYAIRAADVVASSSALPRGSSGTADFVDVLKERHEGLLCPACEEFLSPLLENLSSSNGTLEDVLRLACDTVLSRDPALKGKCDSAVRAIPAALSSGKTDLLQKYTVREVCAIMGACEVSCCLVPIQPEQIRLAVANPSPASPLSSPDPGPSGTSFSVRFTWVTRNATDGDPTVILANAPRADDRPFSGSEPGFRVVSAPAAEATMTPGVNGWRGRIHSVVVPGIVPGREYYYMVGDSAHTPGDGGKTGNYWSRPGLSFSAPPLASANATLAVAVVGDMGATDISDATAFRLTELRVRGDVSALLIIGDISYADMAEYLDDDYGRKIEPVSGHLVTMTVPGNHEAFFRGRAYAARWPMPPPTTRTAEDGASFAVAYYSFDMGPAHFVMLNTEMDNDLPGYFGPGTAQYEWLAADLAAAAARKDVTPWIVVSGHRPFYCAEAAGHGSAKIGAEFLSWVEPLFSKYGVDLVMTGHRHSYARTYPVFNGTATSHSYADPAAPVYVVNGAAGNMEGQDGHQNSAEPFVATQSSRFGYGVVKFSGAASLEFTFYSSDDASVIDQFTITK